MDTIAATLAAIARLARAADRDALGTMDEASMVAIDEAQQSATSAIDDARAAQKARQTTLIKALPTDRRSRSTLRPMADPADVTSTLNAVSDEIDRLTRDHGMPMRLIKDGAALGDIEAHTVIVRDATLTIGGLGSWPLATIAALSLEDEDFGVLLDDGTLLEIMEDPHFVGGA